MLETLWQDIRYAVRSLRRTPAFTAAAIVTLALGIGANTAIFTLIEAVLLRTVPVAAPEQLYFVAHGIPGRYSDSSNYRWLERVRQRTDALAGATAYTHRIFKVSSDAGVERVFGQYVSGNYHGMLGVPMALGRGFSEERDDAAGASPIAVISDAYWARRFNRSPAAIGSTLTVGGHPVTVVGVTAPQFAGLAPGDAVDLTLPLSMRLLDEPDFLDWTDSLISMPIVVRLKPGIGSEAASQAVAAAFAEYMAEPFNVDFRRTPRGDLRVATLLPAARGDDDLRVEYGTALRVLMGIVGLVLLIGCVNVANLLVVRGAERSREVAVRLSIGASRRRVMRQLVTEGLVLSAIGGVVGFLLAGWGAAFVGGLLRTGMEPVTLDVQPDLTVLVFTATMSLAAGLLFSLMPALLATRLDLGPALKGLPATVRRRGWSGRDALVAAQVALCLVVVFGAGLLVRTLQNLRTLDAGFQREGVVVFLIDARDTPFPVDRLAPLCADVVARLTERPDVVSGACSTMSPIEGNSEGRAITVDGVPPAPDDPPFVYSNSVDADYFATFGMRIVRGRGLTAADRTPSNRVAVISEAMARQYFRGADPIGRTFRWGRREPSEPITIVGVVADARRSLRDDPPPMIYTPMQHRAESARDLLAAVRTSGPSSLVVAAVREYVGQASRQVALTYVRSMDEQIAAALILERLLATLSTAFALLALVLACVGVYGVLAYDVTRRSRDIGITLALGAAPRHVLGGVLGRSARIAAAGIAGGLVGVAFTSGAVSRMLFGVEPRDPATLIAASLVLAATALLAGYFPARRAARVDPAMTLRTE